MLPPLTGALALAGLGLLLAGVVRDSLGLIYLSILCTAIAGVALIVFLQVNRRRAVRVVTEGDPGELGAGGGSVEGAVAAGSGGRPEEPHRDTSAGGVRPGAGAPAGTPPAESPSSAERPPPPGSGRGSPPDDPPGPTSAPGAERRPPGAEPAPPVGEPPPPAGPPPPTPAADETPPDR